MDNNTCPSPPATVNYKSDFAFYLDLFAISGYDAEGKPILEPIGFPDYDWTAKFTTERMSVPFVASSKGGVLTNCRNDNGRIQIVANRHNLCPGRLSVDFRADLPSELYPDGAQLHALPSILDIELTRHAAPCPSAIEAKLIIPYIKGEPFTFDDFTPEQIAEIKRPATEAAEAANTAAGQARSAARAANTLNSTIAEAEQSRQRAETQRAESEKSRVANESDRAKAEQLRKDAEQQRATEFAGFKQTIEGKAESKDLSPVLGEPTSSESGEQFEALTGFTREDIKKDLFDDLWKVAWGEHGGIDKAATDGRRYLGNGLRMTYEEALLIMAEKPLWTPSGSFSTYDGPFTQSKIRTHLPVRVKENYGIILNSAFHASDVEVINLPNTRIKGTMHCSNLRSLTCGAIIDNCTQSMPALVDVVLISGAVRPPRANISFAGSPKLSRQSLINVISAPYQDESLMVITVHPDVYAKLTDEANAEWRQVLLDAMTKNIQFTTA